MSITLGPPCNGKCYMTYGGIVQHDRLCPSSPCLCNPSSGSWNFMCPIHGNHPFGNTNRLILSDRTNPLPSAYMECKTCKATYNWQWDKTECPNCEHCSECDDTGNIEVEVLTRKPYPDHVHENRHKETTWCPHCPKGEIWKELLDG